MSWLNTIGNLFRALPRLATQGTSSQGGGCCQPAEAKATTPVVKDTFEAPATKPAVDLSGGVEDLDMPSWDTVKGGGGGVAGQIPD